MLGLFLFWGYKICTTLIKEKNITTLSDGDDKDDQDDEYDSRSFPLSFPNSNAQNLRRIKQRKGLCFVQASSDDRDDQDDDFVTPYTFQDFRTQV